jgi:hypothetical protein
MAKHLRKNILVNRQNIIANQFKKMLFNMADIRGALILFVRCQLQKIIHSNFYYFCSTWPLHVP